MQWNIKNIVLIVIKYLEIKLLSALNKPQGVDLTLS